MSAGIAHKRNQPPNAIKMAGGKGLGLSITHGIVEDHGGRIPTKSEQIQDTTINLNFPAITGFGYPVPKNQTLIVTDLANFVIRGHKCVQNETAIENVYTPTYSADPPADCDEKQSRKNNRLEQFLQKTWP